ncbi:MAG TPA: AraC family transcriptional regulator [Rhodocyclaceae bacterium]|nr:AraC family transcriptional regulator [Rhodocyclaceae bacterium]
MADILFPPHPDLVDCVHSAFIKALPGGHYVLPASLQPMLLTVLSGRIVVAEQNRALEANTIHLCGGTREMRKAYAEPDTRILTMGVKPGMASALFGLPALELMDTRAALEDLLTPACSEAMGRCRKGLAAATSPIEQVGSVTDLLLALRRMLARTPGLHVPLSLLNSPVKDLAEQFGLGTRQFERCFIASYGQALRPFRHQLRCSQMLARFVCGQREGRHWASVAAASGYCDQAHLTRDLVRFTGHTPGALMDGIAKGDPALWAYRTDSKLMTNLFGPTGY